MTDPSGWQRRRTTPADAARRAEYDSPEYRRTRAKLKKQVDAGTAHCWRCGAWIAPGSKWHVGHDDNDRSVIRGPEDSSCNLKTAASKGARVANANRKARKAGLQPPAPDAPAPAPAGRRRPVRAPGPNPECDLPNRHAGWPKCGHSRPW